MNLRAFVVATAAVISWGCRAPADPERDVREAYMEQMVGLEDASTPWPLASKSYLYFARGFHSIEVLKQEDGGADMWRWAARHAELRLRARVEGPLRIRIKGRGAHFDSNEPRVSIHVDGRDAGHFETREDFSVEIEVAPHAHVGDTFVVEFDTEHSYSPPDDGRDLAFSITEITWL